jgi:hypothetical protein
MIFRIFLINMILQSHHPLRARTLAHPPSQSQLGYAKGDRIDCILPTANCQLVHQLPHQPINTYSGFFINKF